MPKKFLYFFLFFYHFSLFAKVPLQEGQSNHTAEKKIFSFLEKKHQKIKKYCIEGGIVLMSSLLILLVFGLSLTLEKTFLFYLSTIVWKRFWSVIAVLIEKKDFLKAKEICKKKRGPVAAVLYQGILHIQKEPHVLKTIMQDHAQMHINKLEKRMSWISFIITLAPMLGFLGTVLGMVEAFEAIVAAGDISPVIIAHGMRAALITTIGGLIVAIVLQLFYAFLSSKLDSLMMQTEEAVIAFLNFLYTKQ